jgi:hypothetical protein
MVDYVAFGTRPDEGLSYKYVDAPPLALATKRQVNRRVPMRT